MQRGSAGDSLRGARLVLATIAVALASFMNILDTTIAIVALPTIAGNLAATPSQGSWIITSYSICLAVVLPLSGWITRRFGEVRTFCAAIALFSLTSWLCAIATSFNELLLFRALQGCSGGLLLPLSQSLLLRIYPPQRHGLALAIWSITSSVAPVLGPLLGGVITDRFGWHWIFLINVPVGVVCAVACWTLLRSYETAAQREPVDLVGLLLLVVGVISFQLVLDRGVELDWLASTEICVLLGASVLCFGFFLAWEWYEPHPVVDLSLFGHRNFVTGTFGLAIVYSVMVLATVTYPIWLQTVMGYTATWSGLVMAPFGLGPIFLMPLVGQRLQFWDARVTISLGTCLFAAALYLHALSNPDTTAGYVAGSRLFMGLVLPLAWMPLMMLALVGLPQEKMASATGIFNFVRMLASSLGTALAVTVWDQRSIYHRERLAEILGPDTPQFQQTLDLLSQRLPDAQSALAALERAVSLQARTLAFDDVFYLCIALVLPLTLCAWLLPARAFTPGAAA
ncbi:MAG: DHA2 family efflux MFS transporter permease subunit [Halioglobus sp.]|nr:DHA2 family efflux MFS transporter permease subunit [Halioglobus sp.]